MKRTILFEGKVTLAGVLVDFRIYKNEGDDVITHYSFEVNPEVKDVKQTNYHRGDIQRAERLEHLLSLFKQFQGEFKEIDAVRFNELF